MNLKPKENEKDESTPDWMLTYGDMVTLLLVFFVLLFSFSAIDLTIFRNMVLSLKGSFANMPGGERVILPEDMPKYAVKPGGDDLNEMNKFLENLRQFVKQENMENQSQVFLNEQGIVLRLEGILIFESNSSRLSSKGNAILEKLYTIIDIFPNEVEVFGHSDMRSVRGKQHKSNWELSGKRALEVVKYFTKRNPE